MSTINSPTQGVLLFSKIFDLTVRWYIHTKKFPKFDRYTIAQKTFTTLLDIVSKIQQAQYLTRYEKITRLKEISGMLDTVKILIRLSGKLELLREPDYITFESELQQIGRMLGGWIKSIS
jgi:four helix bundle protein